MYEVVWARQLVLVFGNTTQAISAILTGFFGGMAIGSAVGGKLADRVRSPLRLYGFLELAVAAVALATPLLFAHIADAYRLAYQTLEATGSSLALVRFGLALAALAPVTMLMGATLPTLARHLARGSDQAGWAFGQLYAANTIGAILGTAVSAFALIELFGLTRTLFAGAACSAAAGIAALVLSRSATARPVDRRTKAAPRGQGLPFTVAFVSGMTALGYQVLWTRLLSSGTGSTTYIFAAILLLFLVGIAVGALLYGAGLGRGGNPVLALGLSQVLVGAFAVLSVMLLGGAIGSLPLFAAMLITLLPATVVMGLALPIASGLAARRDDQVGADTGALLAVNTLGTVVGTFVVPFLLVPFVGSPRTVVLLAIVNLLLGSALLARGTRGWRRAASPVLAAAAAVAFALGPPLISDPGAARVTRTGLLFASAEDEIASVQAGRIGGDLHLWVAGTSMTALTIDAKLMPLLPAMARPGAQSALVIAFGMGSSFRTAVLAGMDVTGVELVPSVPSMFRYYYPDADAIRSSPHGRLVIADGRNHVELTKDFFDIVVVDPPPPIRSAGTAVLYSREFYAACLARLRGAGVMMEWMPYDQSVDEFRAHVRTFADVFPHLTLVFGPGGYGVFMLGSREVVSLGQAEIRGVLSRPGVTADLAAAPDATEATAEGWVRVLSSHVWLSDSEARRFASDAGIISDDRPRTEYFLVRSLFGIPSAQMTETNLREAAAMIR
ncbi:MAG TPA: fused MFS/spermidine synthase [Candidatus Limnocylindria bacterium]|nr:fused MFS/spermidine synthase [Candidatus Limnocylindria bacterium]